jgi:hypothetical protein
MSIFILSSFFCLLGDNERELKNLQSPKSLQGFEFQSKRAEARESKVKLTIIIEESSKRRKRRFPQSLISKELIGRVESYEHKRVGK